MPRSTPSDLGNGRPIAELGIVPPRPAEFVIIRIVAGLALEARPRTGRFAQSQAESGFQTDSRSLTRYESATKQSLGLRRDSRPGFWARFSERVMVVCTVERELVLGLLLATLTNVICLCGYL